MKSLMLAAICMMAAVNFASAKAAIQDPDDPARSKTISKSFPLSKNDKVNLNNGYGEVQIKTWNKKELRVDIDIKVYSKDDADAQRLMDGTVIEADKNGDQATVKTVFPFIKGGFGSKVKNGRTLWRRGIRVDYIVYMPASNALTLSLQYGNVNIEDFSGPLNAKVQYGSFTTGTVGHLNLDAQYTAVKIGTIKGDAVIKQQYGPGLDIGKIGNLNLTAQYANVKLGTINGDAEIKQQYNRLTIGAVNTLNLKGQYTTVNIGNLRSAADFSVEYIKMTIDQVSPGCKNLNIRSSYSHVSLHFANDYHGDFEAGTSYSPLKSGPGISSKLVSEKGSIKNYTGTIGNGAGAKVAIKAAYGSVNLN